MSSFWSWALLGVWPRKPAGWEAVRLRTCFDTPSPFILFYHCCQFYFWWFGLGVPTPSGTSECEDVRSFGWKFGGAANFAPGNKIQVTSRNSCKLYAYDHCWLDFMLFPLQMTDVDSLLPFVLIEHLIHACIHVCVCVYIPSMSYTITYMFIQRHVLFRLLWFEQDGVLSFQLISHIPVFPHQSIFMLAEIYIWGRRDHFLTIFSYW